LEIRYQESQIASWRAFNYLAEGVDYWHVDFNGRLISALELRVPQTSVICEVLSTKTADI